ncbi:hypothetical protein [Mucisphaera sp.]|uniref:hypothetical protein n=1 Tax=Mucisphaera sp. TaxID=2913024 RepID=UPI003D1259E0
MSKALTTQFALFAALALSSSAMALEVPKEGSFIVLLGNQGGSEPWGAELILNVEDAVAASVTLPDGSLVPLTAEGDGEFFAESDPEALLADLLDGTGVPGSDTWSISVVYPGSVTGTYSFQAQLQSSVMASDLPDPGLILSPPDGAFLTEGPASLIWNEPADAALADLVLARVEGFVPDAGFADVLDANTLDGSLVLNPGSNLESVAIPGPLAPGFYDAAVEYIRFLDPVDIGLSAISNLSGPAVDWVLPPEASGVAWPAGAPLVAGIGSAEHQFEILEVILLGDFDDSGDLTSADLEMLYDAVRFGTFDNAFDLDGSSFFDAGDIAFWLNLFGTTPGDANLDLNVDLIDLSTLATNFGGAATAYAQADFNADGVVDLIDLSTLATNFGFSGSVPEPASGLVLLGAGALLRRRG